MKAQQTHHSSEPSIVVHRVIPAAVVRRLHNGHCPTQEGEKGSTPHEEGATR